MNVKQLMESMKAAMAELDALNTSIDKAADEDAKTKAREAFDAKRAEVTALKAKLDTAVAEAEERNANNDSIKRATGLTSLNLPGNASLGGSTMHAEAVDRMEDMRAKEKIFSKHMTTGLQPKLLSGEELKALAPREGSKFGVGASGGVCLPPAMAIKMLGLKWAESVGYSGDDIRAICKASTMLSSSDALGGYTVPQDFRLPMLNTAVEAPSILQRATIIPAPTGEVTMPKSLQDDSNEYGGMVGEWINEGGLKPKTDTRFTQEIIPCHEFAMHTQISLRLLSRSSIAMENWIATRARQVCLDALETAFINGDGVGKPLGILQTAGIRERARTTAGTVTRKDTTKIMFGLKPYHRAGGVYLMDDTVFQAMWDLEDTTGRGLFTPSMANGPYDMLNGKPYIVTTRTPNLGTDGDLTFVDLREYYVPMEQDIVIKRSDDYDIVHNLATIVIFVVVGGKLVQPRLACMLGNENLDS